MKQLSVMCVSDE